MKQQVFVIHGGEAFTTYDEYVQWLQSIVIDFSEFISEKKLGWKGNLAERLGEDYEVIAPRMPNAQNAKYAEWKIYFEKFLPHLREGVILVGHSLGGIFLAKYLSEEAFPVSIKATFLVAAPHNTPHEHPLADFVLGDDLNRFAKQGGHIVLYHSSDDAVVPISNVESYARDLPRARVERFDARGHFNADEFPELVEAIRALTS